MPGGVPLDGLGETDRPGITGAAYERAGEAALCVVRSESSLKAAELAGLTHRRGADGDLVRAASGTEEGDRLAGRCGRDLSSTL